MTRGAKPRYINELCFATGYRLPGIPRCALPVAMHNVADGLSDDEVDDLIAYLLALPVPE
jgi:cytochrome c553